MSAPPPAWHAADAEALRRALLQARAPGELPAAGLGDYLLDLGRWLQARLVGLLGRALPWAGTTVIERILLYTAVGAAALAALAVLLMAWRHWRATQARRQVASVPAALQPAPPPPGDAAWWRAELARRLAGGALRPALEAAWWWTARRLDPPGLDPSWTTGELLRAGGEAAPRAPLRRLDSLLWGTGAPRRDEVEAVVSDLEGPSGVGAGLVPARPRGAAK
ncbi:MAG TPA: hypothetical protein VGV61_18535 [Thermoanaerobaculia bacterium]|jgi:hypothetical protein|nr:hypothetical protein [Thermoanaerobaculia bacterium]